MSDERSLSAGWTVSRIPAGCRFAFTIVHDADSAYSERLAPLFEVFDALGLRVTTSVFALWADWARGGAVWSSWRQSADAAERFRRPKAVPLQDPQERRFYQDLASRGHEIALHTPSDTSSTRADFERSFALFADAFGHAPTVYTEHSARSNKDAQGNEGADPTSPYYCQDLLRRYAPWIWVDGPGALCGGGESKGFEILPTASPLNRLALERFALPKAFVRTGAWSAGDGDGFLRCYSPENLDSLERDEGIALVYTHLDRGWLDPSTRRMRADIEARLRSLAARPGWFAPAGEILDRASAVEAVEVVSDARRVRLTNRSDTRLERPVLRSRERSHEVVIDSLDGGQTLTVDFSGMLVK